MPINPTPLYQQLAGAIGWLQTYTRDTQPSVGSSAYLLKNSFHNTQGRGGYFPASSGPTEAMGLTIRACCWAYAATGDGRYLNYAIACGNALINYFYRVPFPPADTTKSYYPHWLINVDQPFVSKGAIASDFLNDGYFYIPVSFTNGIGVVPPGGTTNGEKLADVYKVFSTDGQLLWRNVYAGLIAGTQYPIAYWVSNFMLQGQNYRTFPDTAASGGSNPVATGETAGTISLATNFTGIAYVVYSAYVGPVIGAGQLFEPYPMWRSLGSNEANAAFDALWWIWDAYALLFTYTGDPKWAQARDATQTATVAAATVKNPSYWYKKSTSADPLRWPGSQIVQVGTPPSGYSVSRVVGGLLDRYMQVNINAAPAGTYPDVEVQNFVVQVNFGSAVKAYAEMAHSNQIIAEIVVSLSADSFDFSQYYRAYLLTPGGGAAIAHLFIASDFVKWSSATIWYPTVATKPFYAYSGNGGTASVSPEQSVINANSPVTWRLDMNAGGGSGYSGGGLVLIAGTSNTPPNLVYRTEGGSINLNLTDCAGNVFTRSLPPSSNWTTLTTSWGDFNGYGATPNSSGPIQKIEFQVVQGAATVHLYYVGTPPQLLPVPCIAYKGSIVDRDPTAHTLWVGDFYPIGNSFDNLQYNPGVVPFTVNCLGTTGNPQLDIDAWRGLPYFGYQDPYHWYIWGYPQYSQQVLQFAIAAQIAYIKQQGFRDVTGIPSPTFAWAYWDTGDFVNSGGINTFSFVGPDPNTRWSPYCFRGMEAIARYWYANKSDPLPGQILIKFIKYLDKFFTAANSTNPITDIPPVVPPQSNYLEPHAAALIARICLYVNIAGGPAVLTVKLMQEMLDFITSQYISTGPMAGSFAAGQPDYPVGGTTYKQFFAFWQSEIISTLALILIHINEIRYTDSMNGIFPAIAPSFAKITLPDYKGHLNQFQDGGEQRVRTQFTGAGTVLSLTYNLLQPNDVAALTSFWAQVGGTNGNSFYLPSTVLQHPSVVTNAVMAIGSTTLWRWNQKPEFTPKIATPDSITIKGVQAGRGLYQSTIELISVIG